MLPCFIRQDWTRRSIMMLALLVGLGVVGNVCAVRLFMGFSYLFGSIAVLVVLRLYGGVWGFIAGIVAASYTLVLFGHPYALIWLGLEPVVVGYLLCRGHVRTMVMASALYWPLVGGPLIFLAYCFVMQVGTTGTVAALLMYWVIGITNSLVASLVVSHVPLPRLLGLTDRLPPVPIRELIFNLLMLIILIPALLFMVQGGRRAVLAQEAEIFDKLHDTAQTVRYELRLAMARHFAELAEMVEAAEHADDRISASYLATTAHHAFEEFPDLLAVMMHDDNQRPLLTIPETPLPLADGADSRAFLRELAQEKTPQTATALVDTSPGNKPLLLIAVNLPESRRIRTIAMVNDPRLLNNIVAPLPRAHRQEITVTDGNGAIIMSTRKDLHPGQWFDACSNRQVRPMGNGIFHASPHSQKFSPLWQRATNVSYFKEAAIGGGIPWTVTVETSYAPFQQTLMAEHARNLGILLTLCVAALGLAYFLAKRLTAPLRSLSDLTTDLADKLEQHQDLHWPASKVLEIDQLITNSREMARALKEKFIELGRANATLEERVTERTRELTEANAFLSMEIRDRMKAEDERDALLNSLQEQLEFLQILMEAIPNPIFFKDRQGLYLGCNSAFLKLINCTREELIGRAVEDIYPPDLAATYRMADDSLLNRGGIQQYEAQIGTHDTPVRDVIFYKATYTNAENKVAGLVGVILDITDRKRVEAERDRLMLELTQKNKELEGIVYAASHDLRSPLINIEGFSRKIAKSCGQLEALLSGPQPMEQAIPEALEILRRAIPTALDFISSSTAKMDMLLKGLLKLSRLGRAPMTTETLDMNRLLGQVTAAMHFQIQNCGGSIQIDPLPPCQGDAGQVNQIFSNLIDNAIKYRDPDRPLTLQISGSLDGNQVVYLVTDNGIGIASEHVERIWEVFHRLNPQQSEGEGLGLTIVRRLIDRNSGTIRVESTPGAGSTFIVSLPACSGITPNGG
jgi:PAS domain S-box-containing protein